MKKLNTKLKIADHQMKLLSTSDIVIQAKDLINKIFTLVQENITEIDLNRIKRD